jgi:predicted CDP-diglyceride synthetase/phosphatidate cytidylyltransferase
VFERSDWSVGLVSSGDSKAYFKFWWCIIQIFLLYKNFRGDRYEQILLVAGLGFTSLKKFICLHLFALKTFHVTVARGQKRETLCEHYGRT